MAFNHLDPAQIPQHRQRMTLILTVPELQAHSTLRYAAWRAVVAEFAADRLRQCQAMALSAVGRLTTTSRSDAAANWPTGAAWLCAHLSQRYRFGRERAYLAGQAWSVMREAAVLLLDFLTEDATAALADMLAEPYR